MNHFFERKENMSGGTIRFSEENERHIRNTLRMKKADRLTVTIRGDFAVPGGLLDIEKLLKVSSDGVIAGVISEVEEDTELSSRITLFQGIPKGDKLDFIVQKAVELGAYGIVPVFMEHTVVSWDGKKREKKQLRLQKISENAAQQSRRRMVPEVGVPLDFEDALGGLGGYDMVLVPYENESGTENLKQDFTGKDIAVFIGPEGGYSEREIRELSERGALMVSLGRRILRTETAGMCILSYIMLDLEMKGR